MTDNSSDKTVGRRGVLKGAVAAGVGVAAWSVPSITSIGGTPVYAAACTSPVFTYEAGDRNTDCGPCPNNQIRYKPLQTSQCGGTPFTGSAVLVDSNGNAPNGNSGLCPGDAFLAVNGVPAGQTCVVRVIVRLGNCSPAGPGAVGVSGQFSSNTSVLLPAVSCNFTSSNIFTRYQIVCSDQAACLPAST